MRSLLGDGSCVSSESVLFSARKAMPVPKGSTKAVFVVILFIFVIFIASLLLSVTWCTMWRLYFTFAYNSQIAVSRTVHKVAKKLSKCMYSFHILH